MESSTRPQLKTFGATMLQEWRCTDSEGHNRPPGLGRRLHGEAHGLAGHPDGTPIKTGPVARAEGREVSFLKGLALRLGKPDQQYREEMDRQECEAGRAAINWKNPFADRSQLPVDSGPQILDLLEESEGPSSTAPATTTPAAATTATTTTVESSGGILGRLAAPFRRLAAMLPSRGSKSGRKTTAKPRSGPKAKAGASK